MTTPKDLPDIDAPDGTDYNPRYDSEALLLSALLCVLGARVAPCCRPLPRFSVSVPVCFLFLPRFTLRDPWP